MKEPFRTGDIVKHVDADDTDNVPAYRDMRGTVVGFEGVYVVVSWECNPQPDRTLMRPEWLKEALEKRREG